MDKMCEYSLTTSSGYSNPKESSFGNTGKEFASTLRCDFIISSKHTLNILSSSKNYSLKASVPVILIHLICYNIQYKYMEYILVYLLF